MSQAYLSPFPLLVVDWLLWVEVKHLGAGLDQQRVELHLLLFGELLLQFLPFREVHPGKID